MDRYNCTLDDILYSTKIEDVIYFFVSSHVSEIHMSEADLLWKCIMIRDKVFQLPDWFMPSMCQIINYVSCGERLTVLLLHISILCVLILFVCIFVFCV